MSVVAVKDFDGASTQPRDNGKRASAGQLSRECRGRSGELAERGVGVERERAVAEGAIGYRLRRDTLHDRDAGTEDSSSR